MGALRWADGQLGTRGGDETGRGRLGDLLGLLGRRIALEQEGGVYSENMRWPPSPRIPSSFAPTQPGAETRPRR